MAATPPRVGADGLPLRRAPADAPRRVPPPDGDGHERPHEVFLKPPFEHLHPAHRPADGERHLPHAEPAEHLPVQRHHVADAPAREVRPVRAARGGIWRKRRDGAVGRARHAQADDAPAVCVERAAGAEQRPPPVGSVGAARQSVAHHHGVISGGIETAPAAVRYWRLAQHNARFEPMLGHREPLVHDNLPRLCVRMGGWGYGRFFPPILPHPHPPTPFTPPAPGGRRLRAPARGQP